MRNYIIQMSLLMIVFLGNAQLKPEDKLGVWYDLGGNHRISNSSSITTYIQLWTYEIDDKFNFFLLKMGYNYNLNSKLKATVYLAYSDFDGNINMSVPHNYERRITEQILYTHKLGKIPLDHRFRIEHRFFKKSNTNLNVARLRYRIGSTFNLNKTFFVRIDEEVLFTPKLTNTPENRFYTGLGIKLSKSHNVQLGYMNRTTSNREQLHRLQIGLFFKTDLTKI